MTTQRPGGVAIGIGLLLGLAAASLALAAFGAGPAVLAGVLVSVLSYVAACAVARAGRLPRETLVPPAVDDAARPLVRRAERAVAAAGELLDSVSAGPLREQLEPLRRDLAAAGAHARRLAVHHASVVAPLAGAAPGPASEPDAADRLAAAERGAREQLRGYVGRLEAVVAELGELIGLDLAARDPIPAERVEELSALRAAFAEVAASHRRTAAEPGVDTDALPATMKEPLNERTG